MMSATIDAEHFRNYFKVPALQRLINVPVIKLDSQRRFKIEEYYLESFEKRGSLPPSLIEYDSPTISLEMYQFAMKPLLFCLKKSHESRTLETNRTGSILVFLPGIYEIESFNKTILEQESLFHDIPYKVLFLHSSLAPDDQREAFKPSEVTKIILATNIAESSITLPDVKYVIDFCLTKYTFLNNPSFNFANKFSLSSTW